MTQPASVGTQLLYTYQAADHCKKQVVGQSRPATVVRDWGGCYNVTVLTDGVNDFEDKRPLLHLTSIQLSDCVAKGRLHYAGSPLEAVAPEPEPEPQEEPAVEPSAPESAHSEPSDGVAVVAPVEPPAAQPALKKSKGSKRGQK